MEIDLNITEKYRLSFGNDPVSNSNIFGLRPLQNDFCIKCSGERREGVASMGRIWSYYKSEFKPYKGGLVINLCPIGEEDLICKECSTVDKSIQTEKSICENCKPKSTETQTVLSSFQPYHPSPSYHINSSSTCTTPINNPQSYINLTPHTQTQPTTGKFKYSSPKVATSSSSKVKKSNKKKKNADTLQNAIAHSLGISSTSPVSITPITHPNSNKKCQESDEYVPLPINPSVNTNSNMIYNPSQDDLTMPDLYSIVDRFNT